MGYFDDVKSVFSKGLSITDRKSQELRLQSELNEIRENLVSAYAMLGEAVCSHPSLVAKIQQACPGEYEHITSLLRDEQDIQARIDELQRQAVAASTSIPGGQQKLSCPMCGMSVTLDISYCPNCGDNLAELKQGYRLCPGCGTYHTADSVFCMFCGSKTVEIPVAGAMNRRVRPMQQASAAVDDQGEEGFQTGEVAVNGVQPTDAHYLTGRASADEPMSEDAAIHCPRCGAVVDAEDIFCGECGMRVVG